MTSITTPYTGFTSSDQPATVTTTYPSTVSPAVITSKTANKDYQNIQTQHADIVSGMQNQATTIANNKAVTDTQTQAKTQAETDAKLAADKLAIDQKTADAKMAAVTGTSPTTPTIPTIGAMVYNPATGKQTTIDMIGKNPDGSYSVTFADTPNTQRLDASQIGNLTSNTGKVDGTQSALDQAQTDYQNTAKQVQDTITGIANGSVPLNEGQIAQIEGLKQQFQQLIDQQILTNKSASGIANTRGYQSGAAEYDPTFATKTIGTIVQAGANKVADLNVKMASAVATLTEAFKDKDIERVKDAWNIYQDASKARTTALQKTIDDTQKVIKEAQDAKIAAEKVTYDRITKPLDDIAKDAAKNGAPEEVINAIRKTQDVGEAIATAGQYLQTGSGIVGEYQFYKREEEAAGRVPLGFSQYQTLDQNRKIALAKAPTVNEKQSNAYSTINQLLGLKNPQGIPYLDAVNGYFTPQGFSELITAAAEDGISRTDFLKQYGSYIAPTEVRAYKLTPAEIKALGLK